MKTLTDNEVALLKRLANNPCADNGVYDPQHPAWTFNVLKGNADNATFGSLVKKGFAGHGDDEGEEFYWLTDLAKNTLNP